MPYETLLQFQSTLPHGERHIHRVTASMPTCFNPRSHMGSDLHMPDASYSLMSVSIHAPTWGATFVHQGNGGARPVSIHAPTWGATPKNLGWAEPIWFQSTLPHGERRNIHLLTFVLGEVSIHAPTWGATRLLSFISSIDEFQSTLPHGERRQYRQ